MLWGKAWSLP